MLLIAIAGVSAQAVNLEPGTSIRTQYGYLNVTRTQYHNLMAVYANGTVYFNATGLEAAQPQHSLFFRQVSYGNGTMVIRVQTPQEPVASPPVQAINTYIATKNLRDFRYPSIQNAPLTIIW